MAYQIPLRYIKVSDNVAICATRIVAMMSTQTRQARETMKQEKINKNYVNGSGRLPAKTVIVLDNGTVVSSPLSIAILMQRIEKSNSKSLAPINGRTTRRMRVYDVIDEEPDENDVEFKDASTDIDEEEE